MMNVFEEMRDVHSEIKRCRHLCWLINSTDPDDAVAVGNPARVVKFID